jgi:hypothetical protein
MRMSIQSFLEQPDWFPIVADIIGIGATRQAPPGAATTRRRRRSPGMPRRFGPTGSSIR